MRKRSGPAPGEAFPFSRRRWAQSWTRCIILALTALVVMWSGASMVAATAMGVGCAAGLFGAGGLCLGEAFASRPLTANAAVGLSTPAAIQMA
jgi:hypothetical protein